MDIGFIVYLCLLEGDFEVMNGYAGNISYKLGDWIPTEGTLFKNVYSSFLLNKSIEALNRKMLGQNWINIESDCVCCTLDHDEEDETFFYKDYLNEDEAKIEALKLFRKRGVC